MTKKDYIAIADAMVIATIQSDMSDSAIKALDSAIYTLAEIFTEDNPRFDKKRFIQYINKKVTELQ
jgi:hypothetical protein